MDLHTLNSNRVPQLLKEYLGSFWNLHYDDQTTVNALVEAACFSAQPASDAYEHILSCESVDTVPVFTVLRWYVLDVPKSELYTQGYLAHLDDPSVGVLDNSIPAYLDALGPRELRYAVPGLRGVPLITNRLTDPSAALASGTDFWVEDGELRFKIDPFETPFFETYSAPDGDEVIRLWLWRPSFDQRLVWEHYGYVLGLSGESSSAYKSLVGSAYKALSGGSSVSDVVAAFSASTGIDVARGGEVVTDVHSTPSQLLVVTDKSVMVYPANSTARVVPGQVLNVGESGILESGFVELRYGDIPPQVGALVLDRQWLAVPIQGSLLFENVEHPITLKDGRAEFPIGGSAADVALYWEHVRKGEDEAGYTLLDLIEYETGGTDTVNPAQFIAKTSLQQVGLGYSSGQVANVPWGAALRDLCPPHAAVLMVLQILAGDGISQDPQGFGDDAPLDLWDTIDVLGTDTANGWADAAANIINQGSDCP